MSNNNEDKELYKLFLDGDEKAFETLIHKYKSNLLYFIYGYIKNIDVSEDLFQEVILYIFSHKEMYSFDYSLKTYLYIIARSKCLNYLKAQSIRENYIENYEFIEQEDRLLEDIFIEKEMDSNIKKVLNKLKPDYKKVIFLSLVEDLSYKDIAKIMNKNISQVRNLLHRAKVKLRKLLIEENIVERKNNKIVMVLSILIVSIGIISCAGYAIYTIVSNKELKPSSKLLGIFFSDEYENYVEKYDEIVEKSDDVSPFKNTDIKLISSMCSDGFISIEFEIDVSEEDREKLRLDKCAMTEEDWNQMREKMYNMSEEEKDIQIEERKKEIGVNTVRIIPNAVKMEVYPGVREYDDNIRNLIIDGNKYYGYGAITTNKLNDYQYQIFLMYLITDEMVKDKLEYTVSIDNIVLTNGVDISKIENNDTKSFFINSGSNVKYIETDKKFDIKMSREKSLENTKILTDVNSFVSHKTMTKKVDKIIVGPTQTVIKLSTEYKNISLKALSSAFYIENHVSTNSYYKVYDQDGNEIDCWNRETKRIVTYSNGEQEEWGTGDIGNWKDFSNAIMNLEEYIIFETKPTIQEIIIKTFVEERKKDEELAWTQEMVELEDMKIEI